MNVFHAANRERARQTLDRLRSELLDERTIDGHWVGQLSASSLSTATAVSALSATLVWPGKSVAGNVADHREMIAKGIAYLCGQQNLDGGFGDTNRSHSNIATSYLVLAASALADRAIGEGLPEPQAQRLRQHIDHGGAIAGLRRRYGKDKTFVVPIMTNLAIAGLIDWNEVSPLPFEAAVIPQSMYRFIRLPVVSYAIPALVAIGQTRHFHGRKACWPLRLIRSAAVERTISVLRRMQPESGGYLEATPLTSFVVMSLAATDRSDHDICRNGLRFLAAAMSDDGSWPIDTNLATWVTSLAIDALASDPSNDGKWYCESLVRWLLRCQHLERHPFTGAAPGGWGWSDLSGAVPDGDDTPAAMLALHRCRRWCESKPLATEIDDAIGRAKQWLVQLQNRNGGWPTFCRGWGKLPFDRSSCDLTAHAIRALAVPDQGDSNAIASGRERLSCLPAPAFLSFGTQELRAVDRGRRFLVRQQRPDGSWLPLWFGNQDRPDEDNPVYGTAKVLIAGGDSISIDRGIRYLVESQNNDGGWGGGLSVTRYWQHSAEPPVTLTAIPQPSASTEVTSSVEETSVAVDALVTAWLDRSGANGRIDTGIVPAPTAEDADSPASAGDATGSVKDAHQQAIIRGVQFLLASIGRDRHLVPWPIGFYFAKLWYHERLYPLIFATAALGKYLQTSADEFDHE